MTKFLEIKNVYARTEDKEILKGLSPGDTIVTEGSFILKSEMLKGELGEERLAAISP